MWSGATVEADEPGFALHDAHYRFPPGTDTPIPVWVSATGPRTLELAGRVADGVILLAGLHPEGICSRWSTSTAAPRRPGAVSGRR